MACLCCAGAQEHKSVLCAALFAELTYIIYGALAVRAYKLLEDLSEHKWEHWRDPAKDAEGQWEPALTPFEQVSTLGQPTHDCELFHLLYLVHS